MRKRFRRSTTQVKSHAFLIPIVTRMLAVLIAGPLVTTPAIAADPAPTPNPGGYIHRIFSGVLAHDVGGLWSGTRKEGGVDINGEIVFSRNGVPVLAGVLHPNLGLSLNSQGDTSKLYGGVLWELKIPNGVFLATGLGAAVHNGELDTDKSDKKSLGSRVLFRIPIEVGFQVSARYSLSILFDHVSNAYLASPNEGLDTIGLRFGYSF